MTLAITAEQLIGRLNPEEDSYGLDRYISPDNVMCHTSCNSFSVYMLSENRCIMKSTRKGKDRFLTPVVWSSKLKKMVAMVKIKKKRVLCQFAADDVNFSELETLNVPYEITHLIEVEDDEPLVITAGGMIGWLSHLEDHALTKLSHEALDLKNLHSFSTYKCSSDESGYYLSLFFLCKEKLYEVKFQKKKLSGHASPVCADSIQSYCISSSVIYFITSKGTERYLAELAIGPFNEPEILHKLDSSVDPVDIISIDRSQLIIAANEIPSGEGRLLAYNAKFNSLSSKACSASFASGKKCLAYRNPYLVTQLIDGIYTHVVRTAKTNLRNLIGNALKQSTVRKNEPEVPMEISESNLQEYLQPISLLDATDPYLEQTRADTIIPAHYLTEMCERVIKQRDDCEIHQLIQLAEQLDEPSIVLLIDYTLSCADSGEDSVEESDKDEQKNHKLLLSPPQEKNLVSLLRVKFTDSTMVNALSAIGYDHALMLFRFLSERIRSTQDYGCVPPEQVARWCLVILDVFHSQFVRSKATEVIRDLRDKVDEHVNIITILHELEGLLEPVVSTAIDQGKTYRIQSMDFCY